MKIIAIRHGHKSGEDLSEEGIQQSVKVGEKITPILKNTLFLSSPVKRVRDTLEHVLRGANYSTIPEIRNRRCLGLSALPKSFHEKNQARRNEGLTQDEVIGEFLRGEWLEIKPKDIAQNFLHQILGLMKKMNKNGDQNIPDFILGTHQSIIESVILTLFDATKIPKEWRTPIGFSESAEFEISTKEGKPYLIVSYRDYKKSLTFEEIKELYSRLFSAQ